MYPTVDEIQYYNTIAIEMFRRSKKDRAKTINVFYIQKAINETKMNPGDLYDKAARLLIELTCVMLLKVEINELLFFQQKSLSL